MKQLAAFISVMLFLAVAFACFIVGSVAYVLSLIANDGLRWSHESILWILAWAGVERPDHVR